MNKFQARLLQLFDQNFNSESTINQIAKKLGFDYAYANREINKLIKKDIVSKKTVGNSNLCSLNLKNDEAIVLIFDYEAGKKSVFYKKHKVLKVFFSDFLNKAKKENIHSLIVFGSYAKNTETSRSDMDIMIILEDKAQSDQFHKLINNVFKLSTLEINPIIVDRKEFIEMLANKAELNIGKEAWKHHIILYGIERFWELALEAEHHE